MPVTTRRQRRHDGHAMPNGTLNSVKDRQRRRRQETLEEAEHTTLLRKPVKTLSIFGDCVWEKTKECLLWSWEHMRIVTLTLVVAAVAYTLLRHPPAAIEPWAYRVRQSGGDIVYWTLLGILSSVGLGSGLHTFLLRLGPHIIMVANAAVICQSTKFSAKISDYVTNEYESDAFECPTDSPIDHSLQQISIWNILGKVAFPCFLWGMGTALGELPPYFVARAAQQSGRKLEELSEIETLESSDSRHNFHPTGTALGTSGKTKHHGHHDHHHHHSSNEISAFDRAKMMVYDSIQNYGFWAVLVAASIPNPLFDLAGLTCGTFGIPFWTFFGATLVGKACIKVMIQAVFYATVFNPASLDSLKANIKALTHAMIELINRFQTKFVASQYKTCWASQQEHNILRGNDANAAIERGEAVRLEADEKHGVLALPVDDLEKCRDCCESRFPTGQEACKEGCDDFLHNASWLSTLWQALIFAMIVWFFMSLIDNTVHDYLASKAFEDDDASSSTSSSYSETEESWAEETKLNTKSGMPSKRTQSRARSSARRRATSVKRRQLQ